MASESFIRRVGNFTKQMFPFYPNQVAIFGGFVTNYLTVGKLWKLNVDYSQMFIGATGLLLLVYLLRVFDEIKDIPTDRINFPNRPLVSGVLSEADLRKLIWLVTGILIVMHLAFIGKPVFIAFAIVLGFSFLAFKWFFAEKYIRPSLPLALVTHNPIVLLYQYYVVSFFGSLDQIPTLALVFLFGEAITGTAWELSRKIRGSTQEDTYTTYSRLWGRKVPQALVAVILLASWLMMNWAVCKVTPEPIVHWVWGLPFLVWLYFVWKGIEFARKPEVAPPFRTIVETFKMALIVAMITSIALG